MNHDVKELHYFGVSRIFFLDREQIGIDPVTLAEVLAVTFPLHEIANVGGWQIRPFGCFPLTAVIGPAFNFHRLDLFTLRMNAQACLSLEVLQGAKGLSDTAVIDLKISTLDK